MAEPVCHLYDQCRELDGKLLILRNIQGPVLAREDGELTFGDLKLHGGELRPYVDLFFNQTWTPKEACYAPTRSVMGLAPGETVTLDVAMREQVDFTNLFQRAAESSEVTTNTRRKGRELVDADWDGNAVELEPLVIEDWGSLFETIGTVGGAIAGGAAGGPLGAVGGGWLGGKVGGLLDGLFGGGGGGAAAPQPLTDILTIVEEVTSSIEKTESQSTLSERTSSTSRVSERRITRTFSNPYRDRSLELRFIPVFRRFEVRTWPASAHLGLSFNVGNLKFPETRMGAKFGHFLERRMLDPRIASVAAGDLGLDDELSGEVRAGAVHEHLSANAGFYTKAFLRDAAQQRNSDWIRMPVANFLDKLEASPETPRAERATEQGRTLTRGIAWSRTLVRDNTIQAPLAAVDNVVSAWKLAGDDEARFRGSLEAIRPEALTAAVQPLVRNVHLFMGTHIEAVAGQCVLPHVPPPDAPESP